MIKAKVTVFDDTTGREYASDIIEPAMTDRDFDTLTTGFAFQFHTRIDDSDLIKGILEVNKNDKN